MWMVRLRLPLIFCSWISKVNPLFIPRNFTMQKRLLSVLSEQNVTCVSALFDLPIAQLMLYGTHLPIFWILPISISWSEIARWQMPNCSASCFVFVNHLRACNSTSSNFLTVFRIPCLPPCLVSKSLLLKRRNYHPHVSYDGACSP